MSAIEPEGDKVFDAKVEQLVSAVREANAIKDRIKANEDRLKAHDDLPSESSAEPQAKALPSESPAPDSSTQTDEPKAKTSPTFEGDKAFDAKIAQLVAAAREANAIKDRIKANEDRLKAYVDLPSETSAEPQSKALPLTEEPQAKALPSENSAPDSSTQTGEPKAKTWPSEMSAPYSSTPVEELQANPDADRNKKLPLDGPTPAPKDEQSTTSEPTEGSQAKGPTPNFSLHPNFLPSTKEQRPTSASAEGNQFA